jgi:hypothetical protein
LIVAARNAAHRADARPRKTNLTFPCSAFLSSELEVGVTDIFLSYARQDRRMVAKLAQALENKGWRVSWDVNLIGGDEWRRRIQKFLDEAAV